MNITLIGMPGSGKSFIGKRLTSKLGYDLIAIDKLIEHDFGMPLQQVVDKLRDEVFLDTEARAVISHTTDRDRIVVSPGGSVVYRADAMEHLRSISTVIFLDVPLPILERRIGGIPRGIIGARDKTLGELYSERVELYKKYSHYTIDGDRRAESVIADILKATDIL